MPNRPDLHLSCSLTVEIPLTATSRFVVVEEQPFDLDLRNPRNLKRLKTLFRFWGWAPFTAYIGNGQVNAEPMVQTRYGVAEYSWEIDYGADFTINNEVLPETFEEAYGEQESGIAEQPVMNLVTGEINSNGLDPYELPGTDSVVVSDTVRTATYVFQRYVDEVLVAERHFLFTWTLSTPRTILDLWNEFEDAMAAFASHGDTDLIQDGHEFSFTITGINPYSADTFGDEGEVGEASIYEVSGNLLRNIDGFHHAIGGTDGLVFQLVWTIPLGGFTIAHMDIDSASETVNGSAPISSQSATPHKELYRGSYDGNDYPGGIPAGDGKIILPPGFHPDTDFNGTNANGTAFGVERILRSWAQIRLFEDEPWVESHFVTYGIDGTSISLFGLWLPQNADGISTWFTFQLRHVETGTTFDAPDFVFGNGPIDGYSTQVGIRQLGLIAGRYHVRVETDLGYFDSIELFPAGWIYVNPNQ